MEVKADKEMVLIAMALMNHAVNSDNERVYNMALAVLLEPWNADGWELLVRAEYETRGADNES